MNIQPLHDRVIVLPDAKKEKTDGGILLGETAQKRPQKGKVIAVGPGIDGKPMTVKVDDTVLYHEHAGTDLPLDGETYLLLVETDIIAITDRSENKLEVASWDSW